MICVGCKNPINEDRWVKIKGSRRKKLNGCYHVECWFQGWEDRVQDDDEYSFWSIRVDEEKRANL
jgi:hypothetical protein